MTDTHMHYHQTQLQVSVALKVAHTTRGDTWEIEIAGADCPSEAVRAFMDSRERLVAQLRLLQEPDADKAGAAGVVGVGRAADGGSIPTGGDGAG